MAITAITGGGGGGPFSTMAAFIAYMAGRTLTQNEDWAVSGTNTDTAFCDLNQTNWTPAGFTLTLRAASGEGVSAGGRAWWLTSGRAILTNSVTGDSGYRFKGSLVIVRDLQLETSSSSANYTAVVNDGALMERCIARNNATFAVINDGSGAAGVVRSCLLINRQSGGSGVTMSGGGIDLVRCTVVGSGGAGTGFNSSVYTLGKARGCIVYGFGTDFANTSLAGSTHNATDKASFGGTGFGTSGQVSVTSSDFVNTTGGSEDYTPASGSTKLLETGAVISGASVDLFGTSLPQGAINDIGAVERVPSAGMTGSFTFADLVLSGAFATGALSQLGGNLTLDDFVLSGTLGLAPGRIDTQPFKNWSGTLLPGVTVPNVVFLKLDRTLPLALINQVTAGDGVMTVTNAALVTGTYYILVSFDATGANIGAELVLAT
jgi:hypothetical protein